MTNHFARKSTLFTLVLSAVACASAQGCGGGAPLQPAHSSSFFPVRGTADNGAAAGTLHWVYRLNGGQPVTTASPSSATIHFGDENITAQDGLTITQSLDADLTATGVSGHESVDETDHITPDSSPATISEKDINIAIAASNNGVSETEALMFHYTYGATPLSTFFDRDDLDTLPPGSSGSQDLQIMLNGTVTATVTGSGTQSQSTSMTLPTSLSWSLVDQLATFQVLGHDYANVVEVQTTTLVTDPSTGVPEQGTANIWLAKGIGMIREEQDGTAFDVTGPIASELVSTNLTP